MRIFERTIEGNIGCEVDVRKWDCKREPAHCHITYNGRRVGQVWLSSVTFEDGIPSVLNHRQANAVFDFVYSYRYEMEEVYRENAISGAD